MEYDGAEVAILKQGIPYVTYMKIKKHVRIIQMILENLCMERT